MNSNPTPELTIVIATYNERQSLPKLVYGILQQLPAAHIIVVDDNSPDGTGDWVRQQTDLKIELLHREQKDGLGSATIAGVKRAATGKPAWIATMDADLSHDPGDLGNMWQATSMGDYDVVIGSRYVSGGRIENWSIHRRLASRLVNGFARWALWLNSRDNSSALRIYRAETLNRISLDRIDCHGFAYLEQILLHLQRDGAKFHEVPIVFRERIEGRSKVTFFEVVRNLRDLLLLALRRR